VNEHTPLPEVQHLEFLSGVVSLNRPRLNFVKLDSGFGQVNPSDAGPEPTKNNSFEEVEIFAIYIHCWVQGVTLRRDKAAFLKGCTKLPP
jgi:hypothetical protein